MNGVQLDPVSYLLHGLSSRFGALGEESRLRATQVARRQGETVDALVSRFELVRSRARTEGGGVVSVETAALILWRACGVSSEQFQTLTQPFGLRLPGNDAEFAQPATPHAANGSHRGALPQQHSLRSATSTFCKPRVPR